MRDKRNLLVLAISVALWFVIWEFGLRLFIRHGRGSSAVLAEMAPEKPVDTMEARRYIEQMPASDQTDRRWFIEDPPKLPNRTAPSPESVALYNEYAKRGLYPPQSTYIWNRYMAEEELCHSNFHFKDYAPTMSVSVFTPPSFTIHPAYRFRPNSTLASGLVTNQFGLRGHPITLVKPPKTIRIAFVGASTTENPPNFPFSYPEFIEHWLNLYARANHYDVHFEALNAGREGINSTDIAAIVQQELLPLDPDLVVYYEGSNQFAAQMLANPYIPARIDIDPADPIVDHKVPAFLRTHLATADLLDRALNRFGSIGEPRKPDYQLVWPEHVDLQNPDPDSSRLPLLLPVIIKDLDSIKANMGSIGGRLVLCSFEWYTPEGVRLSPQRHTYIYKQLNTVLWPLRYADVRQAADFQNRVFRNYAAARKISFVDVASQFPQDPNLFIDAIHMTATGERVKAWVVFQQLVPVLRGQIESGQLPRAPGGKRLPPPPSQAASKMPIACSDADHQRARVE